MSEKKAASGRHWPWLVGALLLLILTINIAVFVAATSDSGHVIVDDYYTKAVNWDETIAQREHNRALGWQVQLNFRPVPAGWDGAGEENPNTLLHVALLDSTGLPVPDAEVHLNCFQNAHSAHQWNAQLSPVKDGHAAAFRLGPAGLWQFQLEAKAGGERFTWETERELGSVR